MKSTVVFLLGVLSIGLSLVAYGTLLCYAKLSMFMDARIQGEFQPDIWHNLPALLFAAVSIHLLLGMGACVVGLRGLLKKEDC